MVAKVRRLLPPNTKVGHAGTLDPKATGLLILGLGRATKMLGEFLRLNKSYDCVITLGAVSETDDSEGPITPSVASLVPDIDSVRTILKTFSGQITQTPPIYSAKKQQGVPLYRLARRGQKVSPKPQTINIYEVDLKRYKYPELALTITCSSGTYIRAIARDIGVALKTGAYLMALRRTSIGPFSVEGAMAMDELSIEKINKVLLSSDTAIAQI